MDVPSYFWWIPNTAAKTRKKETKKIYSYFRPVRSVTNELERGRVKRNHGFFSVKIMFEFVTKTPLIGLHHFSDLSPCLFDWTSFQQSCMIIIMMITTIIIIIH